MNGPITHEAVHPHNHHIFTASTTALFIVRHGQSHAAYWAKMFRLG